MARCCCFSAHTALKYTFKHTVVICVHVCVCVMYFYVHKEFIAGTFCVLLLLSLPLPLPGHGMEKRVSSVWVCFCRSSLLLPRPSSTSLPLCIYKWLCSHVHVYNTVCMCMCESTERGVLWERALLFHVFSHFVPLTAVASAQSLLLPQSPMTTL